MSTFKKCQVVMLPTNEKSKLVLSFKEKSFNQLTEPKLTLIEEANYQLSNIHSQHLYFISNDEIKEGDWWLNKDDNSLNNDSSIAHLANNALSCKKIIATTDDSLKNFNLGKVNTLIGRYKSLPQPYQSFIQAYVEEYNKNNVINNILVEYEGYKINGVIDEATSYRPKVNPKDNTITITIKKVKNSWSKEEVLKIFNKMYATDIINPHVKKIDYYKWIEENLINYERIFRNI